MIKYYKGDGIGWIRVLGLGFHWKDTRKHSLLFSERNGLVTKIIIGSWVFGFLGR